MEWVKSKTTELLTSQHVIVFPCGEEVLVKFWSDIDEQAGTDFLAIREYMEMSKPPSLEFINVSHPGDIKNRHTKRRIHQHVMKDIGQSRRRNAPSKTVELHVPSSSSTAWDGPVATRALNGRQPNPQSPAPLADLALYADTTGRVRRLESFSKSIILSSRR